MAREDLVTSLWLRIITLSSVGMDAWNQHTCQLPWEPPLGLLYLSSTPILEMHLIPLLLQCKHDSEILLPLPDTGLLHRMTRRPSSSRSH